ncbi:DUF2752 domain-containing protein [Clostridium cellulovorans]|uniref:DUF2752 domain-containing protein n=1 Tax=Clostridium cellulovorans (strain ATCC 35296 / DSM 3052 / OCM 3 / 743B) TaxID=573061 RepID=D9SMB3_CLOC7|nr:DUF2752 domain-containing protein [Clostridium cellulovorans]ADL53769.1 Protein of unknown function DUF2752 [Clostridium cellulovorans 743B]
MKKKVIVFLKNQGAMILALIMAILIFGDCPIRRIFGIPCPSCGITRACKAAFHLDFASAVYYHPLFWLIPVALLYIMFGRKPLWGSKKNEKIFYITIIIIIILVYIYRMITMFPNIEPMTYNSDSTIEKSLDVFRK